MNNISSQKFVSTTKHFPMTAPRWLFPCVPGAFAGCIAKLGVGMALLVITATGFFAPGVYAATKLYATDFSPAQTTLDKLSFPDGSVGTWQGITGINAATGGQQQMLPWNATNSFAHLIVGAPVTTSTIGNYMENQIQQVTGPNGTPVYALYQTIKINTAPQDTGAQTPLTIYRGENPSMADTGDVYYTYWIKLQPDIADHIIQTSNNANFRVLSGFKTVEVNGIADYRILTMIMEATDGSKALSWQSFAVGANAAGNDNNTYWTVNNTTVPVPVDQWFKYEVFWHRAANNQSGAGRYWAAVNGQPIVDYTDAPNSHANGSGGLQGARNYPINRVFLNDIYSGGNPPQYQWTTGLEIWDGFPCGVGVSCAR
jgi:hypothetical protein